MRYLYFFYATILFGAFGHVSTVTEGFYRMFNNCTPLYEVLGIGYEYLLRPGSTMAPKPSQIFLYVYRRGELPLKYSLTTAVQELLESPLFDLNLPVVFYFPGFIELSISPSIASIISNLMLKGGMNIIHVDASKYIGTLRYFYASVVTRFIGQYVGSLLADLVREGVSIESIHLVGFSLGAHIAGITAKRFRELTKKTLPRITGLDPAGICFYDNPSELRLDYTDADFVDVIHSCAGGLGIDKNIGHVDYYPNGGHSHPSVVSTILNHQYAWILYAESILFPKNFEAVQCDNWNSFILGLCHGNSRSFMGFEASKTDRGVYFLRTRTFPPYGLGKNSVPRDFVHYMLPFT